MNVYYECDGTESSWGKRWNVLFNESKKSWIEHFIFNRMDISELSHGWKIFIICWIEHPKYILYL